MKIDCIVMFKKFVLTYFAKFLYNISVAKGMREIFIDGSLLEGM